MRFLLLTCFPLFRGILGTTPNFGDAALTELMRTRGFGANMAIGFALPAGTYKIQRLFWEPYFGVQVAGNIGSRAFNITVEGQPAASILHSRAAAANGYTRMPPLGSNVLETQGNQLLADWINQEANALTSYDKWRSFHFGSNPQGAPEQNPDGDFLTNFQEYLFLTDPFNGSSSPVPNLSVANGLASMPLPALPGRKVTVEHSSDLNLWQTWNAPGNDGIPRNPSTPFFLTAPTSGPKGFFRYQFSEN